MWNLFSVLLERVLALVHDRCTVCVKCTIGSKFVLDAPDGTPRCEAQIEARFGPFEDSVSFIASYVHGLPQMYHSLRNRFGRSGWFSLVTRLKWKLLSVHLCIVLILIQDRCTVCAERTVGSVIILDAPDGNPR
jgi:hypothetical protein